MLYDFSLEKGILGAYLVFPNAISDIPLEAEWFYLKEAKELVPTLYMFGPECDNGVELLSYHKQIKPQTTIELSTITELTVCAIRKVEIREAVKSLREQYYRRQVVKISEELANGFNQEKVDELTRYSDLINSLTLKKDIASIEDSLDVLKEKLDTELAPPLKTFKTLDFMLSGGLYQDRLITIASRPAMGKSALAMTSLTQKVLENNDDAYVLLISLEMPTTAVLERLTSYRLRRQRIAYNYFQNPYRLMKQDMKDVTRAEYDKLLKEPLRIYGGTISLERMSLLIREEKRRADAQNRRFVCVIDYAQIVPVEKRVNSSKERLDLVTGTLRQLMVDLHIPIILLSQVGRGVEARQDQTPTLADLKESGSLEQDSNCVIFLSEDKERERSQEVKPVKMTIAKNREGRLGEIDFDFVGAYMQYEETEERLNELHEIGKQEAYRILDEKAEQKRIYFESRKNR